jgi:hypothetical protein
MFADASFADEYFAKRAFAGAWQTADDKEGLLNLASDLITEYCQFYDEYGNPCQYADEDAPEWLKRATAEQALYLLNLGKDPTQADKKTTLGIIRTDDGTTFDKSFAADIIGPLAAKMITRNGGEILPGATAASGGSGGYFTK